MRSRLCGVFHRVKDRHNMGEIRSQNIYIVDFAHQNDGNVMISDTEISSVNSVHIENNYVIPVFYDGFGKNALPIDRSTYSKQCECVLFPVDCDIEEWVLFIETKYAADLSRAQKGQAKYPECMLRQIRSTVRYFRDKGIIPADKVVHAIMSFPNLIDEFNSWVFPIVNEDGKEESPLDILLRDRILIRATNKAKIIDNFYIELIS